MNHGTILFLAAVTGLVAACGGTTPVAKTQQPSADAGGAPILASAPDKDAAADASSPSAISLRDAGADSAATTAPIVEHPFAASTKDAVSLIDDAIDARAADVWKCVLAFRDRKHDPNAKVAVELGIDQEGHLIAVKASKKARVDQPALDCVYNVLRGAPFPSSHAGVITVTRVFEKAVIYK